MEVEATEDADHSMQPPLHGDMLECVLLHVPPDELTATAALVSSEWRRAARAVNHQLRRRAAAPVVSLVAHIQGASAGRSTHVYDPHSRAWASDGGAPAHPHVLPFRRCACTGGDRVYALSLACMAISGEALGTATSWWRELPPPLVWRVDPVVAVVGGARQRVVVLGGACGAMAAAGVVEISDDEHAGWASCQPMPAPLVCAAPSGRWLSAAASERRVYVVERRTGWASWLDPSARRWGPTRRLKPPDAAIDVVGADVKSWASCGVSRGDERLLVIAAGRSISSSDGLRVVLWSVDGETLLPLEELGTAAMPPDISEKLFDGGAGVPAGIDIGAVAARNSGRYRCSGYVYNAAEPNKGAAMYELQQGDDDDHGGHGLAVGEKKKPMNSSRWEWLPCPPPRETDLRSANIVLVSAASQD